MKYTDLVQGKEYIVCGSSDKSFIFLGVHESWGTREEKYTIKSKSSNITYDFSVIELEDLDFTEVLEPEQDIVMDENQIPGLSPTELERLACLSEELGEAQQAIGKILRHGYESSNPDIPFSPTNRANLERELGDILCVIKMMQKSGDLNQTTINNASIKKELKLPKYLHHQKSF